MVNFFKNSKRKWAEIWAMNAFRACALQSIQIVNGMEHFLSVCAKINTYSLIKLIVVSGKIAKNVKLFFFTKNDKLY